MSVKSDLEHEIIALRGSNERLAIQLANSRAIVSDIVAKIGGNQARIAKIQHAAAELEIILTVTYPQSHNHIAPENQC